MTARALEDGKALAVGATVVKIGQNSAFREIEKYDVNVFKIVFT